jgi:hypothetical protein
MKFDWSTTIDDFDGLPVVDERGNSVSVKSLVIQALLVQQQSDKVDAVEKFKRYNIASKVHKDEDIDISEASVIKEVVGAVMAPLAVGIIWDLLEHPLPK